MLIKLIPPLHCHQLEFTLKDLYKNKNYCNKAVTEGITANMLAYYCPFTPILPPGFSIGLHLGLTTAKWALYHSKLRIMYVMPALCAFDIPYRRVRILDGPYKIVTFLWTSRHLASNIRFCWIWCQTDRYDILLCFLNRGALMSISGPAGAEKLC